VGVFFSIIIPTYNRARLIRGTIASILEQRRVSFEIIVVDDGGEDETKAVIDEFNDTRITYIKTENRERGAARNSGLKIANGDYINYFDSDDIFNPVLERLQNFITINNDPPVVFGAIERISNGRSLGLVKPYSSRLKTSIMHNNFLACGAVFIRRDVAKKNPFSEERKLSGTEDWELWLRLYALNEFLDCKMTIFKQYEHAERSLRSQNADKSIDREACFADIIRDTSGLLSHRFTPSDISLLLADRFSLIALLYCEKKSQANTLRFWRRSFQTSVRVLARKRFWAVFLKLLFFSR